MPEDRPYTISEIASIAGVTPRTVRYYIAQGILPAPEETGRGPHYDDRHLARLRMVRELQKRHLPLADIRRQLSSMGEGAIAAEVERLATAASGETEENESSALDYVRSILGAPRAVAEQRMAFAAPPAQPGGVGARIPAALAKRTDPTPLGMPSIGRDEPDGLSSEARFATETTAASERSQWDRIALTPDIELHVRRPLSRLDNKRVDRLITIARQVLKEETP